MVDVAEARLIVVSSGIANPGEAAQRVVDNKPDRIFPVTTGLAAPPWSLNGRAQLISLPSISDSITLEGALKKTLPLALYQLLIQSNVIPGHSLSRKTPLELAPDFPSVQSQKMRQLLDRLVLRLDDDTRLAVFDDLRYRASIESQDRRTASHCLYHHQAKWLRPVNRKQQTGGLAQKFRFLLFVLKSAEFSFVFLRPLPFGDGRRPIAL